MNKKYRILMCALSLAVVLSLSFSIAILMGGAAEDSVIRLVSYDYIENYLLGYIDSKDTAAENQLALLSGKLAELEGKLTAAEGKLAENQGKLTAAEEKLAASEGKLTEAENKLNDLQAELELLKQQLSSAVGYTTLTLEGGKSVKLKDGSVVVLVSGGLTLSSGQAIDLSGGSAVAAGSAAEANHQLVAVGDCVVGCAAEGQTIILIKGEYSDVQQ